MARRIHDLKCWPAPFDAIRSGEKRHEVRKFDREFNVGDVLMLSEWCPESRRYTGRMQSAHVTHVTAPGSWGLPDDIGVMSIRAFDKDEENGQ